MESSQSPADLEWLKQQLETGTLNLQSISFYLSQYTSFYHQETENSINVYFAENAHFFHFLSLLGSSLKATMTSLRNLEFHHVQWEPQKIKDLGALLENLSSVKLLVFHRNRFTKECLSELTDFLRKNVGITEMMVCESCIGSIGAGLIAKALKENGSLEELQIWDDSIGSKGAEELSKMIEVNSNLKLLTVFDSKPIIATPLISAVLSRSRSMEVHIWSKGKQEKNFKVVEYIPTNYSLRIYQLEISGARRVTCALGMNTTVKYLDFTGIRLKSRWAKEFRWVLQQNQTLKEVNLSRTYLKDKSIVYVAAALFRNQTLEKLYLDGNRFRGVGLEHLLCPLSRFSTLQNQANVTLKTLTFGGKRTKIGRDGLAAILHMLTTNETLTRFGIKDDKSLSPDDFVKIFKCLEKNASLKFLSLQGCKGVYGDSVRETIMNTIQLNPWIEEIDLGGTPLQNSGETEGIYVRLGQNDRTEEPDNDLLNDMPLTAPKSCRVFLCGQENAGKTALCESIHQQNSQTKLPYKEQVRTLVKPVEQAIRHEGIKIKTFKDDDETKISIWNLAGKHEFYSLHDLMFPGHGSASFFLIVSSFFKGHDNKQPKNPTEIVEDLRYWLRFILSNSKKAVSQCMLPNITVVLTHFDKINPQSQDLEITVGLIQRQREKFQGYVEFNPTVFTVDARSSTSVSKLAQHVIKTSKTVIQRVPRVYELCNDLIQILLEWRKENDNKPAMRWKEFGDLCQVKVPYLRYRSRHDNKEKVENRRKAVAVCLHQIGELIYFEELGFLILDCGWFCSEVLCQLLRLDTNKTYSNENNGFVSRKELEKILKGSLQSHIPGIGSKILENLETNDLVKMMLKLELCYEQDPADLNSLLLIPSLLEDGRWKPQRWLISTSDCIYAGRHLECDDSSHMFLTPGFFPRLQVNLYNKIKGLKHQHGATYNVEKYLISLSINGIYVRIELGGQQDYYIDLLACSRQNLAETLRLYQQLIVPAIHSLCHGVTMTEHVLRTDCVQNLTPPRYRKNQTVPLHLLKQALLTVPADGMYDYQHTWNSEADSGKVILGTGFDYARDILSDDDFREVLHRRYHDLHNLALELQFPLEENLESNSTVAEETSTTIEPTFAGLAKGIETILQRLKIIEQEIRDVKQEIQGLRYYEHRLLLELHHKVNYLTNYNVQLEERKVPNLLYFVTAENYSRKLVTTMISGMCALRLHMLCEFRGEIHVVEDQIGCELMQVDNKAVKSLAPYLKKFMKLLTFALKIGAHLAAGMGEMIPDLSKEIACLVDSPLVYGAGSAAAAGVVGATAVGGINGLMNRSRRSNDIQQDLRAAQQWILDFLREQKCSRGQDIAEKFGLWRVTYRDDGHIAWICRRHMYNRASEIVEVPI